VGGDKRGRESFSIWLYGCSKRPSGKAAASENPKAYSVGYVEGLRDARTMLEGFFNSR
jgi:hypothetical protein